MATNNSTALVPVKSSWSSKINWTQAAALVVMLMSFFGIDDPELLAQVNAGVIAVTTVATTVMRTWFSKSVTAASVEK